MDANQRQLLKFQRQNVLDSESSDSDVEDMDIMKLIDHKNLAVKTRIKAELKQAIDEVTSQDQLSNIDKKILRGLYEKKIKKNKAE